MNLKRNPYVVIGLGILLFIAFMIILLLVLGKFIPENTSQYTPLEPNHQQAPKNTNTLEIQETFLGSEKPTIVMFYADWCGHSKNLLPVWSQVSQNLNKIGKVDIVSLEQKKHGLEIQQNGITGFPTIRYYPSGFPSSNYIEYKGNRTVDSLMKFVLSGGHET